MIHHITTNVKPKYPPCKIDKGHHLYFLRGFCLDYHPKNENIIYVKKQDYNKARPYILYSNKLFQLEVAKFTFDIKFKNDPLIFNGVEIDPKLNTVFEVILIPIIKTFLINGTSSAGKSSILSEINIKGYRKDSIDHFGCTKRGLQAKSDMFNPNIEEEQKSIGVDQLIKSGNLIFDTVTFKRYVDCYNILIFTKLEALAKNVKRRMHDNYRSSWVFIGYSKFYKVDNTSNNPLEVISRPQFEKILEDNCKFLFKNKLDLKSLALQVFINMGATDDKKYKIVSRYNYDLIINNNSTPLSAAKKVTDFIKIVDKIK